MTHLLLGNHWMKFLSVWSRRVLAHNTFCALLSCPMLPRFGSWADLAIQSTFPCTAHDSRSQLRTLMNRCGNTHLDASLACVVAMGTCLNKQSLPNGQSATAINKLLHGRFSWKYTHASPDGHPIYQTHRHSIKHNNIIDDSGK